MTENSSRDERRIGRAVGKGFLILCSILFLAAGLLYAGKRDLNNGKNKSYAAEETGYTRLTAGDTIQQRLVVSHSFNGVSLTFGRRGVAANAGYVSVTILREEDGSAVMERIIPVLALESGSCTYFAAAVDIPVSGEETFEVLVGYHGLVGSSVSIELGTAAELEGCRRNGYLLERAETAAATEQSADAGADRSEGTAADTETEQAAENAAPSLVCGIVTQYSNHARDFLFSAASVLLAFTMMLYLIHFAMDLSAAERHEREKKAFLLVYACSITIVFLIRLSYAEKVDTTTYSLGGTAENTLELLDDRSIDSFFELPADGIVGVQLSPMDTGERILGEESLVVTLLDTDSGKVLQREEFLLKNQPAKGFYYLFDDTYEQGTRLSLHFQSVGLIGEGVQVGIAGWPGAENLLYYGGARIEQQALSANLYAVTERYDYTNALVRFAAELSLGVLFWYLLFVRRLPLYLPHWYDPVEQAYWVQGRERLGEAGGNRRRMLRELALVLLFGLVVLEYVYSSGIGELPQRVTGEAITYAGESTEDRELPREGNALQQTFLAGEDALSGFGLHLLEKGASNETLRDCADAVLHVRLIDAQTRETVQEAAHRIGDLTRLAEHAGADDLGTAEGMGNLYVYVPLEETVEAAEGHRYTLELYAEYPSGAETGQAAVTEEENGAEEERTEEHGTEETAAEENGAAGDQAILLIRGEEENEGGRFNLILCYRLYQELPAFYFIVMGTALAGLCGLCVLTKWSRVPEWKLAMFWMLLVGGLLTFLLPLFCVPDDGTHYRNIYYLSNRIFGVFRGIGGEHMLVRAQDLPILAKLSDGTVGRTIEMRRYHSLFKELREGFCSLGAGAEEGSWGILDFFPAYLDNASVWTYLPSVLGFSLVRLAGGNFTMMVMGARWVNLLVTTLLIVQAIRRCPYGQRALMVVAMFPIVLQQIGSCSYDAMTIGWAFMAISYGFHVLERTNVTVMDMLILLLSDAFLLMNKRGVYFPVVLIALLVPRLRSTRKRRAMMLGVCLAAAALSGMYAVHMLTAASAYVGKRLFDGDIYTAGYFLENPLILWHLIVHFVQQQLDGLFACAITEQMGILELRFPDHVWVLFTVILGLSILSNQSRAVVMKSRTRVSAVLLCIQGVLVMALTFTVTMSHVGDYLIQGMQGRYFLPYIALGAVILAAASNVELPQGKRVLLWTGVLHYYVLGLIFLQVFGIYY